MFLKSISIHKHSFPATDRSLLEEGPYSGLPNRIKGLKRPFHDQTYSPEPKKKNIDGATTTSLTSTPPWVTKSLYSPCISSTQATSISYNNGHFQIDEKIYTKGAEVSETFGRAFLLNNPEELNDTKRTLRFDYWTIEPFRYTEGNYASGPGIIPTIRGQIPYKEYSGYFSTKFLEGFSVRENVQYLGEKLNEAKHILQDTPPNIPPEHNGSLNFARYLFFVCISLDLLRPIRTIHSEGANLGGHGSYDYGLYHDRIHMDLPARLTTEPRTYAHDKGLYTAPELGIMAGERSDNTYYPNVAYNEPIDLNSIIGAHMPLPPNTHPNTRGQSNDMWDFGMTLMHMVLGDHLFSKANKAIQFYLQDNITFENRIKSSNFVTRSNFDSDMKSVFSLTENIPSEPEKDPWESFSEHTDRIIKYYESLENRAKDPDTKHSIYIKILKMVNAYIDQKLPFLTPLKPLLFSCLSPNDKQRPSADVARNVLKEFRSKLSFFGPIDEKVVTTQHKDMFQKFLSIVKNNKHTPTHIFQMIQQSASEQENNLKETMDTQRINQKLQVESDKIYYSCLAQFAKKEQLERMKELEEDDWGTVTYEEGLPSYSPTNN